MISTPSAPWKMRAIQLDLARQKETLKSIREFISFAQSWGYNTLVLYLEGVVRTESFPYRSIADSYTPDEMRQIVEFAVAAGMDVMPALATLNHAESFLCCSQLAHLTEIDGQGDGMFCPSNEGTYQFLERYISDLAPLFPGRNFHIGCDETWPLGSCPKCRQRIHLGESPEEMLITHILRVREILGKLGKRVWIWDDRFENDAEEKMARLPRDVGMCSWHYCHEYMGYDGFRGHFNRLKRYDPLRRAARLGFDILVCPWVMGIKNTMTITEMAREQPVLGGLQTIWGLDGKFLPSTLPTTALTGALWSNPGREPEAVLAETLEKLFPTVDDDVRIVIRAVLTERLCNLLSPQGALRGGLTLEEVRNFDAFVLYERLLRKVLEKIAAGMERDMLAELHAESRIQLLAGRMRKLLPKLVDPRVLVIDCEAQRNEQVSLLAEFDDLIATRSADWKRFRPGIEPNKVAKRLGDHRDQLEAFFKKFEGTPASVRSLLNVRLYLGDSHRLPTIKIEVRSSGVWKTAYEGGWKPFNFYTAQYDLQVPLTMTDEYPDRLRFTVSGYGGQGIGYASIAFSDRKFVPQGVASASGEVIDASAVLVDDSSFCYLGSPDHRRTLDFSRERDPSSIEILLTAEAQ